MITTTVLLSFIAFFNAVQHQKWRVLFIQCTDYIILLRIKEIVQCFTAKSRHIMRVGDMLICKSVITKWLSTDVEFLCSTVEECYLVVLTEF